MDNRCEDCGKTFSTWDKYLAHLDEHTDAWERQYGRWQGSEYE